MRRVCVREPEAQSLRITLLWKGYSPKRSLIKDTWNTSSVLGSFSVSVVKVPPCWETHITSHPTLSLTPSLHPHKYVNEHRCLGNVGPCNQEAGLFLATTGGEEEEKKIDDDALHFLLSMLVGMNHELLYKLYDYWTVSDFTAII